MAYVEWWFIFQKRGVGAQRVMEVHGKDSRGNLLATMEQALEEAEEEAEANNWILVTVEEAEKSRMKRFLRRLDNELIYHPMYPKADSFYPRKKFITKF